MRTVTITVADQDVDRLMTELSTLDTRTIKVQKTDLAVDQSLTRTARFMSQTTDLGQES